MIAALVAFLASCRSYHPPPISELRFPFPVDSVRTRLLGAGASLHFLYVATGPWAIHVLDIDRRECLSAVAVKGPGGAIGRERTSNLLRRLDETEDVVGGVNADFFLFAPPGVPTGALISGGRVIAGPIEQVVLAFDSTGTPYIGVLRARGRATVRGTVHDITGWNRGVADGLALFDSRWGTETDTASAVLEVVLDGGLARRVAMIDTTPAGVPIPPDGVVLRAGRNAPPATRAALLGLARGETVDVSVALTPFHPREAVGGRPVLVRDSVVVAGLDTVGQPGFSTGRHPRSAVGIANQGRRLLLVVIDGRQAPYSDGMTLAETAGLVHALGARDAINLDGGGSTALVYADPDSAGSLRVANRPSDATGERAVGDALGIVRQCTR